MALEQIIGKKSVLVAEEALRQTAQAHSHVVVDLGTGDGLFALRLARQNPEFCVIGFDADRASLAEGSGRAAKKPARGGAPNAHFFCQNVLDWDTTPLEHLADQLVINFPWGSLLAACSLPQPEALAAFAKLAKPNATFQVYLNMHTFQDEALREKFGLPELTENFVAETLVPAYAAVGLMLKKYKFLDAKELDVHSTWGGKLNRRSGRDTLYLEGTLCHGA